MSTSPFPIVSSGAAAGPRDTSRPVMLVGFQEQANLGLGYLASTLREQGYRVEVFDFEADPESLIEAARELRPVLIGFSLIFQFYIDRFGRLMRLPARSTGSIATSPWAGTSRRSATNGRSRLHSRTRQRGAIRGRADAARTGRRLGLGGDWRDMQGIAYLGARPWSTPAMRAAGRRPRRRFRFRSALTSGTNTMLGRAPRSCIASRGCARTCSFCSIHMFYRTPPGQGRAHAQAGRGRPRDADAATTSTASRSSCSRTTTFRCSVRCGGAGPRTSLDELHRSRSAGPRDLEDQLPRRRRRRRTVRRDARRRAVPRLHGSRVGYRGRTRRRCTSRSASSRTFAPSRS